VIPRALQTQLSWNSRIWVVGFITTPNADRLDLNMETVRLLRQELRSVGSVTVVEATPMTIDNERAFTQEAAWRTLAEEHGSPLIVTGSVKLLMAPPTAVQRGIRTQYVPAAGRVLDATVVLINGITGRVMRTSHLPKRTHYGVGRYSTGLAIYFDLMRQSRTDWFNAIGDGSSSTAFAATP